MSRDCGGTVCSTRPRQTLACAIVRGLNRTTHTIQHAHLLQLLIPTSILDRSGGSSTVPTETRPLRRKLDRMTLSDRARIARPRLSLVCTCVSLFVTECPLVRECTECQIRLSPLLPAHRQPSSEAPSLRTVARSLGYQKWFGLMYKPNWESVNIAP